MTEAEKEQLKFRDEILLKMVQSQDETMKTQVESVAVQKAIALAVDKLTENMVQNNERFILHQESNTRIETGVNETIKILLKWLKYLAVVAAIAIGGGTILTKLKIPFLVG